MGAWSEHLKGLILQVVVLRFHFAPWKHHPPYGGRAVLGYRAAQQTEFAEMKLEMQSSFNTVPVDLEDAEDMLRRTPQVLFDEKDSMVSSLVSESASEDVQNNTIQALDLGIRPSEAHGVRGDSAILDTGLLASQLQRLAEEQAEAHSQTYFHASAGQSGVMRGMHEVSSSVLTLSSRLSSDHQATCSQTSSHCSGAFFETDPQGESVELESSLKWEDWKTQGTFAQAAHDDWDTLEEGAPGVMAQNAWGNWQGAKGSTPEVRSNQGGSRHSNRPPLLPGTPVRVQRYLEQGAADVKQKHADDWTSNVDSEGFVYYYSAQLNRSQWERPEGFADEGLPETVPEDADLIYAFTKKEARRIAICSLLAVLIAGTAISCTYVIIATV